MFNFESILCFLLLSVAATTVNGTDFCKTCSMNGGISQNNPSKKKNKKNTKSWVYKWGVPAACGIVGGLALVGGYKKYKSHAATKPGSKDDSTKSQEPIQSQLGLRRGEIFKFVTGFDEINFKSPGTAFNPINNGFYTITNPTNGRTFQCGKIQLESVGELKATEQSLPIQGVTGGGCFKVIYLEGGLDSQLRCFADIASLQTHPANRGGVFQIASRFNCLENCGVYRMNFNNSSKPMWLPNCGKINFTRFEENCCGVQGEESAISAAPGGILRMYGPTSINLLERIDTTGSLFSPTFPLVPGGEAIDKYPACFCLPSWQDNLLICFHEGIEAVLGLEQYKKGKKRYNNYSKLCKPGQIIHQIPVSAFNFSHDTNDFDGKLNISQFAENVAKSLLQATYRGTLLSTIAHIKGPKKIFLTMVGAGVFGNKEEWVIEAISKCQDLIQKYDIKVYLVAWGQKYSDFIGKVSAKMQIDSALYLNNGVFSLNGKNINVIDQDTFNSARAQFDVFLK